MRSIFQPKTALRSFNLCNHSCFHHPVIWFYFFVFSAILLHMNIKVSPSILASDFSRLCEEISRAESAGADYIHVDVMDGHFVPNLTIGPPILAKIKKCTQLPFDVHLMIDNPEIYAPRFIDAGADIVSFHVEAPGVNNNPDDISVLLADIAARGSLPGLVLKPASPANTVFPYLDLCRMILVMTVEPGFGGQEFMREMLPKIKSLRDESTARNLDIDIEVDGGIDAETAPLCFAHGANVFVSGTFLFGHADMAGRIRALHDLM